MMQNEAAVDISQQKKALRKQMRLCRRSIPTAEKQAMEAAMQAHLLTSAWYQQADVLLIYLSVADEFDTYALLQQAWTDGKRTAVPRCEAEHQMRFYEITDLSQLQAGAYDIPEPKASCNECTWTDAEQVLCLVPGLAFDRSGGRMGYGGGYYDRFLAQHPEICTIGMAAECLVVEKVPSEDTDRQLCGLLTEKKLEVRNGR